MLCNNNNSNFIYVSSLKIYWWYRAYACILINVGKQMKNCMWSKECELLIKELWGDSSTSDITVAYIRLSMAIATLLLNTHVTDTKEKMRYHSCRQASRYVVLTTLTTITLLKCQVEIYAGGAVKWGAFCQSGLPDTFSFDLHVVLHSLRSPIMRQRRYLSNDLLL